MKQLVCEICGSTEIRKQDGAFVCQSCGCQYDAEEAKKLMIDGVVQVEGTVKVDDSNRISNLEKNIRRTFDNKKYFEAYSLCSELLRIDSRNPEALVYSALADGWQITFSNVSHIVDIQNQIIEGLKTAHSKYADTLSYGELATVAILHFRSIADGCDAMCVNQLNDAMQRSSDFMNRNKNAGYLGSDHVDWAIKTAQGMVNEVEQIEQLKNAMIKAVIAGKILVEDAAMESVESSDAFTLEMLSKISDGVSGPAAERACKKFKKEIAEKKKQRIAHYWQSNLEEKAVLDERLAKLEQSAQEEKRKRNTLVAEREKLESLRNEKQPSEVQLEAKQKETIEKANKLSELSPFKIKEAKQLRSEIDNLKNQVESIRPNAKRERTAHNNRFDPQIADLEKQIKTHCDKIDEIGKEIESVKSKLDNPPLDS